MITKIMQISKTGIGIVISLLAFGSQYFKLDLDEGQITEAINAVLLLYGVFQTIYGQFARRDLKMGLIRK